MERQGACGAGMDPQVRRAPKGQQVRQVRRAAPKGQQARQVRKGRQARQARQVFRANRVLLVVTRSA